MLAKKQLTYGIFILLATAVYFFCKPAAYLTQQFDFWLAILLSPFIIRSVQSVANQRFAGLSLSIIGLLFVFRSNALYYFAFGCALLFFIEKMRGRLNPLTLFLLLFSSALFRMVMSIWSFPIRLELSALASKILSSIGLEATHSGNIIILNGQEFAVDAACMGLNLTTTALLLTLLILAFQERKSQRYWTFASATGMLIFAFLLSVAANFSRLLLLVLFKIMPEHPLHELLGLVSIIVYVLLPIFLVSQWVMNTFPQWSRPIISTPPANNFTLKKLFLPTLLIIGLFVSGWQFRSEEIITLPTVEETTFPNFTQRSVKNEILELRNDSLLIYIKPPSPVYRSTHDPRICWQGSGYRFSNIQVEQMAGHSIYTAILVQGTDRLHTAWWFAADEQVTISEWEWRWKTIFNNQAYSLINISAEDSTTLKHGVIDFFTKM